MKLLVYPHELAMGGSQTNAIELGAAVRDLGHDVTVFATPGVLSERVAALGLDFVEAPARRYGIDLKTIRQLLDVVRSRGIELIHAYEWAPAVDAYFGPALVRGTPVVMTVLSMDVPEFLPNDVPLIVGTRSLAEQQRRLRSSVHLIEPPVDTLYDKATGTANAREQLGIRHEHPVVAVVGRLTPDLEKLQGVLEAISVVDRLATDEPLQLVIAGDGPGLGQVQTAADGANRRHGREVVLVLGLVADPRPVYDAADVVFGMGSSALRAMSFCKPVIVQGTAGFWSLCTPANTAGFLQDGWFGHGKHEDLESVLRRILSNPGLRRGLGQHGRALVQQHFGLDSAAQRLVDIYLTAAYRQPAVKRANGYLRTGLDVTKFRASLALQASGKHFASGSRL